VNLDLAHVCHVQRIIGCCIDVRLRHYALQRLRYIHANEAALVDVHNHAVCSTYAYTKTEAAFTDEEVYAMGVEKKEIIVNYEVGDTVRILDGPLTSFTGTVESIQVDNNAVNVIVSMFGRETSVEFELDQIEVVSQ
jgi:transcription antitermination factor NusG